jgi:hypothetical protein
MALLLSAYAVYRVRKAEIRPEAKGTPDRRRCPLTPRPRQTPLRPPTGHVRWAPRLQQPDASDVRVETMTRGFVLIALPMIALVLVTPLWSQGRRDLSTDLYNLSLGACIQSGSETTSRELRPATRKVMVLDDHDFIHGLPAKIGEVQLEYLQDSALRTRYAQLKRDLPVIALAPMQNRGEVLVVRCWSYSVKVQKKKMILGVLGGRDVEFRFDCTAGKYVLDRVNKWALRVD